MKLNIFYVNKINNLHIKSLGRNIVLFPSSIVVVLDKTIRII